MSIVISFLAGLIIGAVFGIVGLSLCVMSSKSSTECLKRGETVNLIYNEYMYNSNFKKYVDDYCEKNNCTLEDAFNDEQIRQMFWRYSDI